MKTRTIFGILLCVTLVFVLALAPSANAASDEEEVLQVMTRWFQAFNTSDYDLMSSLWWNSPMTTRFGPGEQGTLLMEGIERINRYWKSSLDMPPGASMNSLHHPEVTLIGNDVAIITGYNIQVSTDQDTEEQSIGKVRGTFVVKKIDGKWLIVHEHSSLFPVE